MELKDICLESKPSRAEVRIKGSGTRAAMYDCTGCALHKAPFLRGASHMTDGVDLNIYDNDFYLMTGRGLSPQNQ